MIVLGLILLILGLLLPQSILTTIGIILIVVGLAAEAHGYRFVDVTERFVDHGVNAPEPWLIWPTDPGSFHPNRLGYRSYAAALTAAIRPSDLR